MNDYNDYNKYTKEELVNLFEQIEFGLYNEIYYLRFKKDQNLYDTIIEKAMAQDDFDKFILEENEALLFAIEALRKEVKN